MAEAGDPTRGNRPRLKRVGGVLFPAALSLLLASAVTLVLPSPAEPDFPIPVFWWRFLVLWGLAPARFFFRRRLTAPAAPPPAVRAPDVFPVAGHGPWAARHLPGVPAALPESAGGDAWCVTLPPPPLVPLLEVELVPQPCRGRNLDLRLGEVEWRRLRGLTLAKADYRCEVCGRAGRGSLHCHEVWHYDDAGHVQALAGLVALCVLCHGAKHPGGPDTGGAGEVVVAHLARVNGWTLREAGRYLGGEFEVWGERNRHAWALDLSWANPLLVGVPPLPTP